MRNNNYLHPASFVVLHPLRQAIPLYITENPLDPILVNKLQKSRESSYILVMYSTPSLKAVASMANISTISKRWKQKNVHDESDNFPVIISKTDQGIFFQREFVTTDVDGGWWVKLWISHDGLLRVKL